MARRITLTVHHQHDATRSLTLIARVGPALGCGPELVWEPEHLPAQAVRQLKSALLIGLLTGLRRLPERNWRISVEQLKSGSEQLPEDEAATVACALILAHGSGHENLHERPHGGFAWRLHTLHDEPCP